jgi:hypothetical protein
MRRMINFAFGLHTESCVLVRRRENETNDKRCIWASYRVMCASETEKE